MRRLLRHKLWIGAAGAIVLIAALDLLFPPDLSRARQLSTVVSDAAGQTLHPFIAVDGRWRLAAETDAVDARYVSLLKAYEDRRFDHHFGVDAGAIARALMQWMRAGHIVSGASTLSMQTARLLAPGPGRSLGAKLVQALRAVQLERRYRKGEILRLYMTLAPFGGNLEGIRAASLAYFGKEPKRLTVAEAALLVALPQSPERQRPDRHLPAAKAGRDKVLRMLADRGAITLKERDEAISEPLSAARRAMPVHAPHLARMLAAAAPSGAIVRTEINGALQRSLEALARRAQAEQDDGRGTVNTAMIVVETATRAVLAYVGNANPGGKAGYVDLAQAVRSPGSALKPLVYAVAFDDLVALPLTQVEDRLTLFGDYQPRNFDRGYQGTVTFADALRYSLNVPAVALLDRIGPARFVAKLSHAGVQLVFPRGVSGPSLPLILGGVGTRLADLVTLYAALGDQGVVRPLNFRTDRPAREISAQFVSPIAAWYVRDILLDSPLPDGWGEGRGLMRRPIAFKTGTSYGFRDAWSIGVSGRYTVGVWVGRPDGSTRPGSIGRNTAAPLLLNVFDLLPPEPESRPTAPKGAILAARTDDLPRGLRHFQVNRIAGTGAGSPAQPLEIAFPPNGAIVPLPSTHAPLALRAEGGHGSLYWIIDGVPINRTNNDDRHLLWSPPGPGYSRITVVDTAGQSATSLVKFTIP